MTLVRSLLDPTLVLLASGRSRPRSGRRVEIPIIARRVCYRVTRDVVPAVALATLALLALGVAAATLADPVAVEGEGFGGGDWGFVTTEPDDDRSSGLPFVVPTGSGGEFVGPCLTWLGSFWGVLATSLVVLLPAAYLSYRTRWLLPGVAVVGAFGVPVYLAWRLLTACGVAEFPSFHLPGGGGLGGGAGFGQVEGVVRTAASQPSLLFGLVLVLGIAAAVVLLFVSTGSDEAEPPPADEDPASRPADVAAIARAAGRAADRIAAAETDVENEVFRAWVEMTDHLAVAHPESSTPAEFADAAVEAGMGVDDVRELTTLFEEVRYGEANATGAREERALAALRRIETDYSRDA